MAPVAPVKCKIYDFQHHITTIPSRHIRFMCAYNADTNLKQIFIRPPSFLAQTRPSAPLTYPLLEACPKGISEAPPPRVD